MALSLHPLLFYRSTCKFNVFVIIPRPLRKLLFLPFLFASPSLWAFAGVEGASFLDVPVGAGPAALGSAYSALANNAYAPVWNPAGLGFLPSTQVSGMHQLYVEKTRFEFLSAVHPFSPGHAFGVSAQYFTPGDLLATDLSGNELGTFSGHYGAYSVSYGQKVTDRLALGLTGKLIEGKIDDVSASTFGGDVGLFYRPIPRLTFAGVVANIGPELKFLDQGDPLPLNVRTGAAYKVTEDLKITGEGVYRKEGTPSFHFGVEWPSEDKRGFCLRTGYSTDRIKELSAAAGVAVGVGIPIMKHEVSYAFMPLGDVGSSHYFSLILRFGEPDDDRSGVLTTDDDHLNEHYELLDLDGQINR
jgi:hypothetical protein